MSVNKKQYHKSARLLTIMKTFFIFVAKKGKTTEMLPNACGFLEFWRFKSAKHFENWHFSLQYNPDICVFLVSRNMTQRCFWELSCVIKIIWCWLTLINKNQFHKQLRIHHSTSNTRFFWWKMSSTNINVRTRKLNQKCKLQSFHFDVG